MAAAEADLPDEHEPLRIRTSRVAAVAGYHPWADPHETFLQHLYGGSGAGRALRDFDATLVGLRLVYEDDALRSLLALADEDVEDSVAAKAAKAPLRAVALEMASVLSAASTQTFSRSVAAAGDAAAAVLARARAAGVLPAGAGSATLERAVQSQVNTSFGTRLEDAAIRHYERATGCAVRNSNDAIFSWSFPCNASLPPAAPVTLPPYSSHAVRSSTYMCVYKSLTSYNSHHKS